MAIEFIKLELPDRNTIEDKRSFIINKLYPLAIRQTTEPQVYSTLFYAMQESVEENYIFFTLNYFVSSTDEEDIIKKMVIYGDNLAKTEQRMKMYKAVADKMTKDTFFFTNLDIVPDSEHPSYHKIDMYQKNKKDDTIRLYEVYIPIDIYIKLGIYLAKFSTLLDPKETEQVFVNPKYKDIELVKVHSITLDNSAYVKENIYTHYTIDTGVRLFTVNTRIPMISKDKKLKNELSEEEYVKLYGKDIFINDIVKETDDNYWILYEESADNKSGKHIIVLSATSDIVENTIFSGPNDSIYE